MSIEARRSFILDVVRSTGEVDVRQVAGDLDVSQMTVRRDLAHLDKAGLLRRVHGGATVRESPAVRSEVMQHAKAAIAAAVSDLVDEGDVVGIDVGSTCTAIAQSLALRAGLTAFTTSLDAALQFQYSQSTLIVLGGMLTPEAALVNGGPLDVRRNIKLDKLVLGCGGISEQYGITYHDLAETAIRHDLVQQADQVILAADHTKFGVARPVALGNLDLVDVLVTSRTPPAGISEALARAGVRVILTTAPHGD